MSATLQISFIDIFEYGLSWISSKKLSLITLTVYIVRLSIRFEFFITNFTIPLQIINYYILLLTIS